MSENRGRVLLILSEAVLGQARVFAGEMTATLRLPVSLQIILRALIEEGLRRKDHPQLTGNIEAHAVAVREARRMGRRGRGRDASPRRSGAGRSRVRQ
jgi:hypothetical protein